MNIQTDIIIFSCHLVIGMWYKLEELKHYFMYIYCYMKLHVYAYKFYVTFSSHVLYMIYAYMCPDTYAQGLFMVGNIYAYIHIKFTFYSINQSNKKYISIRKNG